MDDKVFNKALNLIKKHELYDTSKNISDYWFENKTKLIKVLDKSWPNYW